MTTTESTTSMRKPWQSRKKRRLWSRSRSKISRSSSRCSSKCRCKSNRCKSRWAPLLVQISRWISVWATNLVAGKESPVIQIIFNRWWWARTRRMIMVSRSGIHQSACSAKLQLSTKWLIKSSTKSPMNSKINRYSTRDKNRKSCVNLIKRKDWDLLKSLRRLMKKSNIWRIVSNRSSRQITKTWAMRHDKRFSSRNLERLSRSYRNA